MKKLSSFLLYTYCSFLCVLLFSGCLKDKILQTYTIYRPIFKSLTEVRADMKSNQPQAITYTGKLNLYGNYIFLNEVNKGIHVIDNSNPAAPKNIGFINIPGNVDLAIRGNYLYADSYTDLVVFDISTPTHVAVKKFVDRVFMDQGGYFWGNTTNPDSVTVLVGYTMKDTTVNINTYNNWSQCRSCMFYDASGSVFMTALPNVSVPTASQSGTKSGINGSMSRFAVVNDYLYGVSSHELLSFNITNGSEPQLTNRDSLGSWNIETIYPFKDKLFIGSSNGMFIYNLSNAADPTASGQFSHVRSCDPVIADSKYAYVTLRSGTNCQGFSNQLEILDIANLNQPSLLTVYQMTNPHGLSKDGDLLFICDGKDGLKVYDISDIYHMKLLKTISGTETYDIIANQGKAIVVAKDGLYQYDYSDKNNIRQISKIGLSY